MAKKPASRAGAPAKSNNGGTLNKGVVFVLFAAIIPFSLPTVTILAATLLPTLGAYFSERGGSRYAWLCIGGLNFAGVVPYLFTLWFGVNTEDEALRLLSQGNVLLWSYGASAFGWMLYKATPPVVSSWLALSNQRRVAGLKAAQRKLVEEWGDEVIRKHGEPAAGQN